MELDLHFQQNYFCLKVGDCTEPSVNDAMCHIEHTEPCYYILMVNQITVNLNLETRKMLLWSEWEEEHVKGLKPLPVKTIMVELHKTHSSLLAIKNENESIIIILI